MANLKINDFILMIDDLAEVLLDRDSVELRYEYDAKFDSWHLDAESQSDFEDYTEEAEAILRKIGIRGQLSSNREDDKPLFGSDVDLDPNVDPAEGTMGWEGS